MPIIGHEQHARSPVVNVVITDRVSEQIDDELTRLEENDEVDIVIVPRRVLDALWQREGGRYCEGVFLRYKKVATGYLSDRAEKIHHIDQFCR